MPDLPSAKPYGHGPKCSKPEREARLVIVEDMYFERLLTSGRIERVLSREFGCTERQIRRYVRIVKDRALARAHHDPDPRITRDKLTEVAVARMNSLIDLADAARASKDIKAAISAEREVVRTVDRLAELHGLKVERHEHSGPGGAPLSISPDDAVDILRRELEKAGGNAPAVPPDTAPE